MARDGEVSVAPSPARRAATAAPLLRRFTAWLADGALALTPVAFALVVASAGGPNTVLLAFALACAAVISVANDVVLVVRTGQSIGRRLLGIRVVDSRTMVPPGAWQVVWRTFVGGAGFGIVFPWHPLAVFPDFTVLIGPWPLVCYGFAIADRRWHRAVSDHWSHTVVIDVRLEALDR